MSVKTKSATQAEHLRSGFIFLIAWIGVLIEEIRLFSGGITQQIEQVQQGHLYPLLVISSSIVLLALVFKHFAFYVKPEVKL